MLDVLNRHGHGFVAIPTILACRDIGIFDILARNGSLSIEALTERLKANSGHLRAALRLLESLSWVSRDEHGCVSLRVDGETYNEIPSDVLDWWSFPVASYLSGNEPPDSMRPWLERCTTSWNVSQKPTAEMLDGVFVIPILTSLQQQGLLQCDGNGGPLAVFSEASPVREEMAELFLHFDWAREGDTGWILTELGRFLVDRALILGTLCAYVPMLSRLRELLAGDPTTVFQRDELGHEQHVERTLNVVASGFQHDKYFADVDDIVVSIFDQLPINDQPKYVADMGCGDGSFLKRVYQVVAEKTARGGVSDEQPLQVIAVDFNEKALAAADENLLDVPHLVLKGDIGDPVGLTHDLKRIGVTDPDEVLHVRSFLDHDRPFQQPRDATALQWRSGFSYEGVYVDARGSAIEPAVAIQSLVEHLGNWSEAASRHGLIVLEVHSVAPGVTGRFLDESESLHFDAYHAYSMQYLVEADLFMMCAAEVGLFAKPEYFRRYPKTLPFCRITLSWFEKRPYVIRNVHPEDVPAICELRASTGPDACLISEEQTRQIVAAGALDKYVMVFGDQVVGAALCLRVSDINRFADAPPADIVSCRDQHGETMVLLEFMIHPDHEGDASETEFLQFVLQQMQLKAGVTSVAAVAPCTGCYVSSQSAVEQYVAQVRGEGGGSSDRLLNLHKSCGAEFLRVWSTSAATGRVPHVVMQYGLHDRRTAESQSKAGEQDAGGAAQDVSELVDDSVQRLMEDNRESYSSDKTLYELGFDSLDHMELASLLASNLNIELDSSILFEYDTPQKLSSYLAQRTSERKKRGWISSLLRRRAD